jgi:hypothetical protein
LRLRTPVLLLALAAIVPLTPGAAGAAVTKKAPATHVVPCNDGSGKSARLWYYGREAYLARTAKSWAADNPCKSWMIVTFPGLSASEPYGDALSVAPGAKFQRSSGWLFADEDEDVEPYMSETRYERCWMGWSYHEVRKNGHGKFRPYQAC